MAQYTFPALSGNHQITARFDKVVTINFSRDSASHITGGTYSVNGATAQPIDWTNGIEVTEGSTIVVNPTFVANYQIDDWSFENDQTAEVIAHGDSTPISITATDVDATLTINSEMKPQAGLTVVSSDNKIASGTIKIGSSAAVALNLGHTYIIDADTQVIVNLTFVSGYTIRNWEVTESSTVIEDGTATPITITMDSGASWVLSVTAKTTTQYTITAVQAAGGTIAPSGSVEYDVGATPTYTITPNAGFVVGQILVDGQPVQPDS